MTYILPRDYRQDLPGPDTFKIVGIDPGSDNVGLAVLEIDIKLMLLVKISAKTITGRKMFDHNSWEVSMIGERAARIKAIKQELINFFIQERPISIACESPFFNPRRPNAYGVLVEVLTMIKQAVYEADPWRQLQLVDPPTAKKAVGAPGNADKDKMKECVIKNYGYFYHGDTPVDELDEHSIDAIAVAYSNFLSLSKT